MAPTHLRQLLIFIFVLSGQCSRRRHTRLTAAARVGRRGTCSRAHPPAEAASEEETAAYCDEKVANREIRLWRFVIENDY
jgi:hypothetical protein